MKGWDYSTPGAYFTTFCTHDRQELLGHIESGKMTLSNAGKICDDVIQTCMESAQGYALDRFVIMPNHIHLLINVNDAPAPPLDKIIRSLKAQMTLIGH